MANLVVAYPELSPKDFDWIQAYREQHDPRYFSVIEPHFTIVFAGVDCSQEVFVAEVKKQSADLHKFEFELKIATINQDFSGDFYHEFLVPDAGYSNIILMHDKLYSGEFRNALRLDIDFIPHVGIGNSESAQESKARIDKLNTEEINIKGRINTLDVIKFDGSSVETVEKIELG